MIAVEIHCVDNQSERSARYARNSRLGLRFATREMQTSSPLPNLELSIYYVRVLAAESWGIRESCT